jgi:hypothetical protein
MDVISMEFKGILKLNISGCTKLTNRSIISLGRHCGQLQQLQAVGLEHVSPECFAELRSMLPKCKIVLEEELIMPPQQFEREKKRKIKIEKELAAGK